MQNGDKLNKEEMIILQALDYQPPPTIKSGETHNADDMIDYMNRVDAEMNPTGANLNSKFQAATGAMHSSVPLLATTSTGTRPVSTTDADTKQPDEEKKEEVALRDAPADDGYAEEKSSAEHEDTKAPVNIYTTNPAFHYF